MALLGGLHLSGGSGHLLAGDSLGRHLPDFLLGEPGGLPRLIQGGGLPARSRLERLDQLLFAVRYQEHGAGRAAGRDVGEGQVHRVHPPAWSVDDGEGIGALSSLPDDGVAVVEGT
ncbi:MAG: hypothetical protein HC869_10945 [Rhodospirillales bacterium]|nr:hypothetical protein [Rhodospirillales bacterium]